MTRIVIPGDALALRHWLLSAGAAGILLVLGAPVSAFSDLTLSATRLATTERLAAYALTVRPHSPRAEDVWVSLTSSRPVRWVGRPAVCDSKSGTALRCVLGDIKERRTLLVSVRRPSSPTRLTVTAGAEDERPQSTIRIALPTAEPGDRPSASAEPSKTPKPTPTGDDETKGPRPGASSPRPTATAKPSESAKPTRSPSGKPTGGHGAKEPRPGASSPRPTKPGSTPTDQKPDKPDRPGENEPPSAGQPSRPGDGSAQPHQTPTVAPSPTKTERDSDTPRGGSVVGPTVKDRDDKTPKGKGTVPPRNGKPRKDPKPSPSPAPTSAMPLPEAPPPGKAPGEITLPPISPPSVAPPTASANPPRAAGRPGLDDGQVSIVSPADERRSWATVLAIVLVLEVALLWLAVCLGLLGRRITTRSGRDRA